MSKVTYVAEAAPPTPDSGKAVTYVKTDKKLYLKDDAGSETDLTGGGSSLPVVDTTSIVEDPGDATKEMRIDVGAVATGTVRVLTMPNADVTLPAVPVGTTDAQTLTNKTIDADNSTITNIGAAEVKANLVNGQTADATPDGAADYVMTHDGSASALKKVLLDNLPSSAFVVSYAILRDEKATTVNGGSSSSATWNNRDLNTETYDPDGIVSISSNQFTPDSGDYILSGWAAAGAGGACLHRLRLYNVTGTASVEEGLGARVVTAGERSTVQLMCKFTANGTDAYRIDHFTSVGLASTGLGLAVGDGSAEVFLEIKLEKVA